MASEESVTDGGYTSMVADDDSYPGSPLSHHNRRCQEIQVEEFHPEPLEYNYTTSSPVLSHVGYEATGPFDIVAARAQLHALFSQRDVIRRAEVENRQLRNATAKALERACDAYEEFEEVYNRIELADAYDVEDHELVVAPLRRSNTEGDCGRNSNDNSGTYISLPLFPRLSGSVPLFKHHVDETIELRSLVTTRLWLRGDLERLRMAVRAQCKRAWAFRFLNTHLSGKGTTIASGTRSEMIPGSHDSSLNPLDAVETMSDFELFSIALPQAPRRHSAFNVYKGEASNLENSRGVKGGRTNNTEIDRDGVAADVGSHTAEECRTRWLCIERPDIHHGNWTLEEQDVLTNTVERLEREGLGGHWETIAQNLDFGSVPKRTGWQCLVAYQQKETYPRRDVLWSECETQELARLVGVFGPSWGVVAERLATARSLWQVNNRFHRSAAPQLRHGKWSMEEDNALIFAVATQNPRFVSDTSSSASTQQSSALSETEALACAAELDAASLDFVRLAGVVPGRTSQQCNERWVGRLERIVREQHRISLTASSSADASFISGPARPSRVRRRLWTEEEDQVLLENVDKDISWIEIGQRVGNRTDKQVRERWLALLKNSSGKRRQRPQTSLSSPVSPSSATAPSTVVDTSSKIPYKGNNSNRKRRLHASSPVRVQCVLSCPFTSCDKVYRRPQWLHSHVRQSHAHDAPSHADADAAVQRAMDYAGIEQYAGGRRLRYRDQGTPDVTSDFSKFTDIK